MTKVVELTNPNYRYTFGKQTITNVDMPEGLYKADFRGSDVVLQVDRFGEVRVATETPCNNEDRLAQSLMKAKFVDQVMAKYNVTAVVKRIPTNKQHTWEQKVEAKYAMVEKVKDFVKDKAKKLVMALIAAVLAFNSTAGMAKSNDTPKDPTKVQQACDQTAKEMTKMFKDSGKDVTIDIKCVKQGGSAGFKSQAWKITPSGEEGKSVVVMFDSLGDESSHYSQKNIKVGTTGTGTVTLDTFSVADLVLESFANRMHMHKPDIHNLIF